MQIIVPPCYVMGCPSEMSHFTLMTLSLKVGRDSNDSIGMNVLPIHRHHGSSETVVILRGRVEWSYYDESGVETESVLLDADGDVRCINVERDRWHSLECLESAVQFECKNGPYRTLEEDEMLER